MASISSSVTGAASTIDTEILGISSRSLTRWEHCGFRCQTELSYLDGVTSNVQTQLDGNKVILI